MSTPAYKKILGDLSAMNRMIGPRTAFRFLGAVARTAPTILRTRNLLVADRAMGADVLSVRHPSATVRLPATAFSGIREIYLRDVYGMADHLKVQDGGLIVDLGANVGNFTALALASNSTSRAIAVEACVDFSAPFRATMELNGLSERVQLCRAFIGSRGEVQTSVAGDPRYAGAEWIDEAELLTRYEVSSIDLLKVDIEGSEFAFLEPDSRLFDISRQLAVEVHGFAGDAKAFLNQIEAKGFRLARVDWDRDTCIALATR